MFPTWPSTLTNATDTARFSGVRPMVLDAQVEIRGSASVSQHIACTVSQAHTHWTRTCRRHR